MTDNGPSVVGREAELQRLAAAFEEAVRGHGSTVLVEGAPGVGKTRLLATLRSRIGESDVAWLEAACVAEERGIPYRPLRRALGHLPSQASSDARIGTLLGPGAIRGELAVQRTLRLDAIVAALRGIAGELPVVLVIDDAQWAGQSTLAALKHIARYAGGMPLLLLIAFRGGDEAMTSLSAELQTRRVATTRLTLEALTWPETRLLVRELLDLPRYPPTVYVDALYEATAGNPLFIEQITAAIARPVDADALRSAPDVPSSISHAIEGRMGHLSKMAREAVAAASIVGPGSSTSLLAAVTGRPLGAVTGGLHDAVAAGILTESEAGTFEFGHPLMREAAVEFLFSEERKVLHDRTAAVVEARGDVPAATVAHHYYEAERYDRAVLFAEQAGDEALAAGAAREAAGWYEMALISTGRAGVKESIELLEKITRISAGTGRARLAVDAYQRLIAHFDAEGDAVSAAGARVRLGRMLAYGDHPSQGLELIEQAIASLRPLGDGPGLARALASLGTVELDLFHITQALAAAREARDLARDTSAIDAEALSLRVLGAMMANTGDLARGCAMLRESAELSMRAGEPGDASFALHTMTNALIRAGEWAQAEAAARQGAEMTRARGELEAAGGHLSRLAEVMRFTGRWQEAETAADEALLCVEDLTSRGWRLTSINRAHLMLDTGRAEEARVAIEPLVKFAERRGGFDQLGSPLFVLSRCAVADGDDAGARALIARAIELWEQTDDIAYGPPMVLFSCRLSAASDDSEALEAAVVKLSRLRDRVQARAPAAGPLAALRAYTGSAESLLAASEERWDDAVVTAERAFEAWSSLGRVFEAAQAQVDLGRVLLRRGDAGDRDAARGRLLSARETMARLGAAALVEVDRILTQSRLVAPRSRRGSAALTERELQIAKLVAEGRSNREIGATLYLSDKTVRNHISRIFDKLELTSRAQLAAYVVEHAADTTTQT